MNIIPVALKNGWLRREDVLFATVMWLIKISDLQNLQYIDVVNKVISK